MRKIRWWLGDVWARVWHVRNDRTASDAEMQRRLDNLNQHLNAVFQNQVDEGSTRRFLAQAQLQWQRETADSEEINAEAVAIGKARGEQAEKLFKAAIVQKLKDAEQGLLQPPGDVKTQMRRNPRINEIRWQMGSQLWRLYYAEPTGRGRTMLALRFAQKVVAAGDTAQDAEILLAGQRLTWWLQQHTP